MIFILQFMWHITHVDLREKSLHPWDKSKLTVVYDPFHVLVDSVC